MSLIFSTTLGFGNRVRIDKGGAPLSGRVEIRDLPPLFMFFFLYSSNPLMVGFQKIYLILWTDDYNWPVGM